MGRTPWSPILPVAASWQRPHRLQCYPRPVRPIRWIAVCCAIAVLASAFVWREPFRLGLLFFAGRSPQCPIQRAVAATADELRVIRTKDRILAASELVEEDPAGFELWDTPDGRYWIPKGNQFSLPFNLAEEQENLYRLNDIGVHEGDIVLDCGASVGVFTRRALDAGADLVVAIEPAPLNLECLRRNFADEIEKGSVIVYPKGVWDQEDTLTLHIDPERAAAASFLHDEDGWQEVENVPLTTIDLLADELGLPRVDFIKMDIEGSEPRAIRGARRTIARYQPRMAISTYHVADHPVIVPATVFSVGPDYRMRCGMCGETERNLIRPIVEFFE